MLRDWIQGTARATTAVAAPAPVCRPFGATQERLARSAAVDTTIAVDHLTRRTRRHRARLSPGDNNGERWKRAGPVRTLGVRGLSCGALLSGVRPLVTEDIARIGGRLARRPPIQRLRYRRRGLRSLRRGLPDCSPYRRTSDTPGGINAVGDGCSARRCGPAASSTPRISLPNRRRLDKRSSWLKNVRSHLPAGGDARQGTRSPPIVAPECPELPMLGRRDRPRRRARGGGGTARTWVVAHSEPSSLCPG